MRTGKRTLNDWVVTRGLRRVPGVAEVANFGGYEKQFAVTFNQAQLKRFGLTLGDVEDAITKNNSAGGGSVVTRGSMSMVVRGKGQLENLEQIENIFGSHIEFVVARPRQQQTVLRIQSMMNNLCFDRVGIGRECRIFH